MNSIVVLTETGHLYAISLQETVQHSNIPVQKASYQSHRPVKCLSGESPLERFGSSFIALDINGDGKKDMVVASSGDIAMKEAGRKSGIVRVLWGGLI
jgi:hypothetical protein